MNVALTAICSVHEFDALDEDDNGWKLVEYFAALTELVKSDTERDMVIFCTHLLLIDTYAEHSQSNNSIHAHSLISLYEQFFHSWPGFIEILTRIDNQQINLDYDKKVQRFFT